MSCVGQCQRGGADVINCSHWGITQNRLMLSRDMERCKRLPWRSFHLGRRPGRCVTVQMFISDAGSLANNKRLHVAMDGERLCACLRWGIGLLANVTAWGCVKAQTCAGSSSRLSRRLLPCALPLPIASPFALSLRGRAAYGGPFRCPQLTAE